MSTKSNLVITPVIYGAMGYGSKDSAEQIRTIQCAIDYGISSIDTAPLYGAGDSERIVGKAVRGCRDKVQLLTKCGLRWDSNHGQPLFEMNIEGIKKTIRIDCRSQSIEMEVNHCLNRLNVDYIDLWQVHHFDHMVPLEEIIQSLIRIKNTGKIREIGVSNYSLDQALHANILLDEELFSVQNEFSLLHNEQLGIANELYSNGIRFIAYSPLAQGILSGLRNEDSFPLRFGPAYRPKNIQLIQQVIRQNMLPIAEKYRINVAQLSLAWALAHPSITALVAGCSTESQCKDNAAVLDLQIDEEDLNSIYTEFLNSGYQRIAEESAISKAKNKLRELSKKTKNLFGG